MVVGDRPEELAAALADGLQADLCVVSGGLGPTHDDRTVELLAASTGRALSPRRGARGRDRGVFARCRRAPQATLRRLPARNPQAGVSPGRRRLARARRDRAGDSARARRRPSGDRASRPAGRAQAALAERRRTSGYAGARRRADAPTRRSLRFFGPTESAVARVLDENGGEEEGFEATVCARDLEIHVDLVVRPGGEAVAARLTDALVDAFTADLFARDDERPVEEIVLDLCRQRGWTLATAESCTGG